MGIDDSERISLKAFIVVNGFLFGLALFFAITRMVIRFHSQRRLNPDDFGLLFACSTFIASQALLYIFKIENIYLTSTVVFNPSPQNFTSMIKDPEAFIRQGLQLQRMEISCVILNWTSIFAVKISFLLFFHQMITRVQNFIIAWRVIFGITIVFWPFCTFTVFLSCPHFGLSALSCAQGHGLFLNIALSIIGVILDIASDLLLISLPLMLLWKVKMRRRQKILLGIFLCLSVCMIIISSVRVSGFMIKNTIDLVWILFWHHAEAAVAITMLSISAFPSLLGIKALKAREKNNRERYWFSHRRKLLANNFKKATPNEYEFENLPSIPGATLTGMRTFIEGCKIGDESRAIERTPKFGKNLPAAGYHESYDLEAIHEVSRSDNFDGAKNIKAVTFV